MAGEYKKLSWHGLWVDAPLEKPVPDSVPIEEYNPLYPLQDGQNEHFIPMMISGDDWSVLFSCIVVGANTIYPDDNENVVWKWLRFVENYMDLCTLIAQCINEAVPGTVLYDALQQWGAEYGANNFTGENLNTGDLTTSLPCNPDNVFATTLQLVQLLNTYTTDVYDRVDLSVNQAAAISALLELVPPIGQVIEVVEVILNQLLVSYAASYDQALEGSLACRWFCLVLENDCQLTVQDLITDLGDLLGGKPDLSGTFELAVNWMLGQQWQGDRVVYASFAVLLITIEYGARWAGLDFVRFERALRAIVNDTNPDWNALCDECSQVWCYTWDFTNNNGTQGWLVSQGRGTYTPNGFAGTFQNNNERSFLYITAPKNGFYDVTECTIEYQMLNGAGGAFNRRWVVSGGLVSAGGGGLGTDLSYTFTVTPERNTDRADVSICSGSVDGDVLLRRVTIKGVGENPYGDTNC